MLDSPMPQLKSKRSVLPKGYKVNCYEIRSVIGRGGFGITYLAHDTNLDRPVAIKEYLPSDFSTRDGHYTVHPKTGNHKVLYNWGLERFLAEAQTLAKFEHANVIHVNSVFEENNTAYMVMRFESGEDLASVFDKGKLKKQQSLLNIVLPILDGLKLVHKAGFIHRDIKPANIYIREDFSPVLLDFGSARQSVTGHTSNLTRLISHSYTPFEQYNDQQGKQGPWTDIYSMGATLYFGVMGRLPVDALLRGSSIIDHGEDSIEKISIIRPPGYTLEFLEAIDWALEFRQKERPQNCADWIASLIRSGSTVEFPAVQGVEDNTRIMPVLPETDSVNDFDILVEDRFADDKFETVANEYSPTVSLSGNAAKPHSKSRTKPNERSSKVKQAKNTKSVPLLFMITIVLIGFMGAGYYYYAQFLIPAQKKQEEIRQLLTTARIDASEQHQIFPVGANAYEKYVKVLLLDVENVEASNAQGELLDSVETQITVLISGGEIEKAEKWIKRLVFLDASLDKLPGMTAKLKSMRLQRANHLELNESLQMANLSLNSGNILWPDGNSAILLFSKILMKHPENKEAKNGYERAVALSIKNISENISVGNISKASMDLAKISQLDVPKDKVVSLKTKIGEIRAEKTRQQKLQAVAQNKKQEAERRKLDGLKAAQAGKSSLQIINEKLSLFVATLEKLDVEQLTRITNMSVETKQKIVDLDNKYKSGTVSILSLGLHRKQGLARAKLVINQVVDGNGMSFKSETSWRDYTLTVYQHEGVWTNIVW